MDYKKTLNLPRTDFPMKANLAKNEPGFVENWEKGDLYGKIIENRKGSQSFVMHDGPPYANGHIHHGHILNKVLKDIVVKYKNMSGFRCEYLPGWDCHGLPIEHQVDKQLKKKKQQLSKSQIRGECRKYAQEFIEIQRDEFKRLGILGRWEKPYKTMDYTYESRIAKEFAKIVKEGFVYKKKKPVHWCISCATALAEAEVEYDDHSSPSIYVAFPIKSDVKRLGIEGAGQDNTFMMIWTTTPWTIPANLAIALNPDYEYVAIEEGGKVYILALGMLERVAAETGLDGYKKLKTFKADEFKDMEFYHPLYKDRVSKIVYADYVTLEAGTGAVHTAPGHGQEDFETGHKYGLEIYSPVDDRGIFDKSVGFFAGQQVFKANEAIVEKLKSDGRLLAKRSMSHSYPHCWRCKKPVIFRATEQWFISVDHKDLRKRALEEIDKVKWIPKWGRERIYSMVESRPDWCVSRQRVWGNPLMSVRCKECNFSFVDDKMMENVASIFEKESTDVWFEKELKDLAPKGFKCPKCGKSDKLEKENDILDVWFDSGSSHAAVLEDMDLGWPSDIYLEGSDQHRGWFQSSLLESMTTRGKAPYRSVLTHGFVVDGKGKKMSKSLGNFIPPQKIIDKYGAEILRLWVAAEDYRYDIRLSEEILSRMVEAYRRIRNTGRFILGNLSDFDPDKDKVAYKDMHELDKWILDRTERLIKRITKAYDEYEFHVLYHQLHNFCVVDLSSIYLDIIKDRLYVSSAKSLARRSAQTTIFHIVRAMARFMAPVFCFTSEEIYGSIPDFKGKKDSVHMEDFPKVTQEHVNDELFVKWEKFLKIRSEVSRALEISRKEGRIGHSLDAKIIIRASQKDMELLKGFGDQLKYYFIVSNLELSDEKLPDCYRSEEVTGLEVKVEKSDGTKCERCWIYSYDIGKEKDHPTVCGRCAGALRS